MTDRCYADGAVNPTGDEMVQTNGVGLFDCDSRYHEPTDAYTRACHSNTSTAIYE